MFKFLIFLMLLAVAFARPGYLHSAPLLTTYHEHVAAVPAVHVVEPFLTTHSIVAPVVHSHGLDYGYHGIH